MARTDRQTVLLRGCALVGCLLGTVSLVGVALAATVYSDPLGDVRAGAGPICGPPLTGYKHFISDDRGATGPDVTSVSLSHTKANVTFNVRFASAPPLRANLSQGWTDMLLICLDVPPFGATPKPGGPWLGADFGAGATGTAKTGTLLKVAKDGNTAPVARFKVITRGSTLAFSIPRRALKDPASFSFQVTATRETDPFEATTAATVDIAPARGAFRYALTR